MNFCIYNKELDQYLLLNHYYKNNDFPHQSMAWIDEFESIISDPDTVKKFFQPYNTTDKKSFDESEWDRADPSVFLWIQGCIDKKVNPGEYMKDMIIVPINASGLPVFTEAVTMFENWNNLM